LQSFTARWPRSGSIRNGEAYRRPTLARLMAEIAGGASPGTGDRWPTPTRLDSTNTANRTAGRTDPDSKHHDGVTLVDAIRRWATPSARDWRSGEASDETFFGNSRPLNEQARRWQTPRAEDSESANQSLLRRLEGRPAEHLNVQARDFLSTRPGPTTLLGKPSANAGPSSRPRLNPFFEEWLMFGPEMIGWTCVCATEATGSGPSETPSMSAPLHGRSESSGTAPSENCHE
jgi:hypothetical protein